MHEYICAFDFDMHPVEFVSIMIEICLSMKVNCCRVRSCIVVSIQNVFSHGCCFPFCENRIGELEEFADESVLDIVVDPE